MTKIKYSFAPFFSFLLFVFFFFPTGSSSCYAYERKTPVVEVVEKVGPAVVNIGTEYTVSRTRNPFSDFRGLGNDFFNDFFDPGFKRKYKRTSIGSGVIIDGNRGYILTNAHVVSKRGDITVTLNDKREFTARVIGMDPDSDVAVLHIESDTTLPSVEMGTSDALMIGETVIAIGNPFGFSHTVTTGVISAVDRSIKTDERVFQNFIQTDASINPGNSGGPLLNINGELIGINTAIYAKAQGIGFAIPINMAKRIISDLILYGEVVDVWTGLVVQDIDSAIAAYLNIPQNSGVLVKFVEKESPAAKGGVVERDIITKIDEKTIASKRDFASRIKEYANGDTIRFKILHLKKEKNVFVKVRLFPEDKAPELGYTLLGIRVESYSKKQGVIITEIADSSHLAKIGVEKGDLIRQIDEMAINSESDFNKAIIKYRLKDSVVVLLQRGQNIYYLTVRLGDM